MKIRIQLSAANMAPEATEADFDAWASFVASNIAAALGIEVTEVSQFEFDGGPSEDWIQAENEDQTEAICSWLSYDGWEAFCSKGGNPEPHVGGAP